MTRPNGWRPCSSARVPMWRVETATYPCAAINCEDSICRASGRASPPCTTFSSPGPTGRRQRNAFSGRNLVACLLRSWHPSSYRQRLSARRVEPWARLKGYRVADAMIEALRAFLLADAAGILLTRDIEDPRQRVLDTPVLPHGLGAPHGLGRQRREKIPCIDLDRCPACTTRFHHPHAVNWLRVFRRANASRI